MICKVCKQEKPASDYNTKRTDCKECQRAADKKRNQSKKTITGNTKQHKNNIKTITDNTTDESELEKLKIYNSLLEETIKDKLKAYDELKKQYESNTKQHKDNTIQGNTCILSLAQQKQLVELLNKDSTPNNTETILDNIKIIQGNTKKQTFVVNVEILDKLNKYCKQNRLTQSIVLNWLLNGFLEVAEEEKQGCICS